MRPRKRPNGHHFDEKSAAMGAAGPAASHFAFDQVSKERKTGRPAKPDFQRKVSPARFRPGFKRQLARPGFDQVSKERKTAERKKREPTFRKKVGPARFRPGFKFLFFRF